MVDITLSQTDEVSRVSNETIDWYISEYLQKIQGVPIKTPRPITYFENLQKYGRKA